MVSHFIKFYNGIKMKTKFMILFSVVLLVITVIYTIRKDGSESTAPIFVEPDLSKHRVYSSYEFSKKNSVIDIGVQPLWLPASIITEAMKHDIVLRNTLSKSGMSIRFFSFFKGADLNYFIKSGDLEAGIGGDMSALTAVAVSDVHVVGLIQHGFCAIVSKKHLLMSELRGKRIGFPFSSLAHYALLDNLSDAGISDTDVTLVAMDVNELPDALNEGRIAAFSAWEPTPTIALNKYKDQVAIRRNRTSGFLYFDRSFSVKHPETARHIIAAEIRAIQWMQKNRQNLLRACEWGAQADKDLSGTNPQLSVEQFADLALNDLLGLASYPIIPERDLSQNGSLQIEYEFLKSLGAISDTTNWEEIVDNFDRDIMREVINYPDKYFLNEYNYGIGKIYE